jgi:DNA-binding transcriptional MerR regulator
MNTQQTERGVYRSGVAARLAGVRVDTLRIWERRYRVVGPRVSAGRQRLYSAADIKRLTLIKQLVDMGYPIGTIAALADDEIAHMRAGAMPDDSAPLGRDAGETRIALVGSLLMREQVSRALAGTVARIVASSPDPDQAVSRFAGIAADLILVELPTLRDSDLLRVASIKSASGASRAIVLYRFAPSAVVRRMRLAGHAVAHATSDPFELEALCLGLLRRPPGGTSRAEEAREPRPPRFDERTLADLAGASRTLECECPRHLVDLVISLASFERYSAECASRTPADVALHLELQRAAGRARAIMEQALEYAAMADGVVLPPAPEAA